MRRAAPCSRIWRGRSSPAASFCSTIDPRAIAMPRRLAGALAARGETPASHRDGRGAPPARRDDREYREYLSEEQRRRRGCIARRMQPAFYHGLLEGVRSADPLLGADEARESLRLRRTVRRRDVVIEAEHVGRIVLVLERDQLSIVLL